jgi:hypothetical protein
MPRFALGLAAIALVSGVLAVGRIGSDVVDNIAALIFIGAMIGLLLMLVGLWGSQNL